MSRGKNCHVLALVVVRPVRFLAEAVERTAVRPDASLHEAASKAGTLGSRPDPACRQKG